MEERRTVKEATAPESTVSESDLPEKGVIDASDYVGAAVEGGMGALGLVPGALGVARYARPVGEMTASALSNLPRAPGALANLAFSGKLLTYEVGLRFLTDHLLGDIYFGTKRPGHNLDRARNQFQLVRQLEARETEMNAFVDDFLGQAADPAHRLQLVV